MTEQAQHRMGTMERDGDQAVLRFERHLPHPPEKVWRALTESDGLRHWFPVDIVGDRRAGADVQMRFWPTHVEQYGEDIEQAGVTLDDPVQSGRILTWEPPRVFELMWDTDRLLFELEADGADTRLTFTTWTPLGGESPHGVQGALAGYHVCFDALAQTLATGSARLLPREEITALEREYAALAAD